MASRLANPFLQSAHNGNGPGRQQDRSLENCFAETEKMVQKASQAPDIATTPGACQEKKGPQGEKGQNNEPIIEYIVRGAALRYA
jgi:hypothetical protein